MPIPAATHDLSPALHSSSSPLGSSICHCVPSAPASKDLRHAEKHVRLPNGNPQPLTVATMLTWPQSPPPGRDTPRSRRELQLFQIRKAFLQLAWLVHSDCDIHMEISDTPSKTAPRVIVETPVDHEYCPAREQVVSRLAAHGIRLSGARQELKPPLRITVVGLAFEDPPHSNRGSSLVHSFWELHPAIVTVH